MVDQNVPQFPKRWNIVAPFEGMTIGDLDQLTGIQVV